MVEIKRLVPAPGVGSGWKGDSRQPLDVSKAVTPIGAPVNVDPLAVSRYHSLSDRGPTVAIPDPSKLDSPAKGFWERVETPAKVVSMVALPIVIAIGGWLIQKSVMQQSDSKNYVAHEGVGG